MESSSIPSPEQIKEHYILEKRLSDQLRHASKEERRKMYSVVYDELYKKVTYLLPQQQLDSTRQMQKNLRMLKKFLHPDIIFLEIGPGNCLLSFAVAQYVKLVYAVDVSVEVTATTGKPNNFRLVISDGVNIPVAKQSVDFAFSDQLMEHLHPDDALEQLNNIFFVLKPGGKYLCSTPNKLSGPHDISSHFDTVATGFHLREYTIAELNAIFKKAGFKKCAVLFGVKGYFIEVSCLPFIWLEFIISRLPSKLSKIIARFLPIRLLLGIKLLATK